MNRCSGTIFIVDICEPPWVQDCPLRSTQPTGLKIFAICLPFRMWGIFSEWLWFHFFWSLLLSPVLWAEKSTGLESSTHRTCSQQWGEVIHEVVDLRLTLGELSDNPTSSAPRFSFSLPHSRSCRAAVRRRVQLNQKGFWGRAFFLLPCWAS